MFPSFCLTRLNSRYNQMSVKTCKCRRCKCRQLPELADDTTPLARAMHEEIIRILKESKPCSAFFFANQQTAPSR